MGDAQRLELVMLDHARATAGGAVVIAAIPDPNEAVAAEPRHSWTLIRKLAVVNGVFDA